MSKGTYIHMDIHICMHAHKIKNLELNERNVICNYKSVIKIVSSLT